MIFHATQITCACRATRRSIRRFRRFFQLFPRLSETIGLQLFAILY